MVSIQIPRAQSGLLLTQTTWRLALRAAIRELEKEHERRRLAKLPEVRLKALLDECVPLAGGAYRLHREYRVNHDGAGLRPVVIPVRGKRATEEQEG
jgi:hypothetical protein